MYKRDKKVYGGKARKQSKHGGPHKMPRYGMAMGGEMEVQKPN